MRTLILLSLSLFLLSCEESRVACLDFHASNYDFGAVTPCDSCCTYPTFSLPFNIVYDSLGFSNEEFYNLDSGDSVKVEFFQLLLSNFVFSSVDSSYQIIDQVRGNGVSIIDDYYLLRSNRLTIDDLGDTNFSDDLQLLSFDLGLNQAQVSSLKPYEFIDSGSQLSRAIDSTYNSSVDEFTIMKIDLLVNQDLHQLRWSNDESRTYSFSILKTPIPGSDWEQSMKLDISSLILDISSEMSSEELENVIINNLLGSLSVN